MSTLVIIIIALLVIALAVCHSRLNKLRTQLADAHASADRQIKEAENVPPQF